MTTPQSHDVHRAIVRAWRDPEYATSLSPETRDAMPPAPENIDALTDDQLMAILDEGALVPVSDEQLAAAAGASNGINYNNAYSRAMNSPNAYGQYGDTETAKLIAQNSSKASAPEL